MQAQTRPLAGESRELGLTEGIIQRLATPAVADWSGTVAALECHVRSLAGAVR